MKMRTLILVLAATLLLLPTAGLPGNVPGVTDTEVVVGVTTPLSGAASLWGVTALGMKAWADHVNAQGGVHGRKIKLIILDDAYQAARGKTNVEEMKGKIFAGCGVLGTAICNAVKDFFPENKIPLVTPYANVRIWAEMPKEKVRYVFVAYLDYEDEAEYITNYAVDKLGAKKIAVFYQNDDYGKMAMVGVEKVVAAKKDKVSLVARVPYELSETALSAHALKLKESGADALILYATPKHGFLITKEIAKIGYMPKRLATFTLGDPIMYKLAGDAWEGTYISLPGNSGVPGSEPAADKAVEILLKYNPDLKGKEYLALFGAVSMMHLVEGLKNAGKDLTPESFIKGMEKISNWKPEGIGAPVTYSADRHHGSNASRMGQAQKGKHVPIEEFTLFKPRF